MTTGEESGGSVRRWRPVLVGLGLLLGVLVLAGLWLVVRTQQAVSALERARDGVGSVRTALSEGDPLAAQQRLTVVQEDTARAAAATSDPVFALASAVPWLGRTPEAVRTVAATSDALSREVLGPLVEAGTALAPDTLRTEGAGVNLAAFTTAAPLLADAAAGVDRADAALAALPLDGTPGRVSGAVAALEEQLAELDGVLAAARDAAAVAPPMLGSDGTRRYFLSFVSNAEARGTGGLIGAWGILRVSDGRVKVERLDPRSVLDDQTYDTLPLDFGPDYAALYGDDSASWGGANLSPHFPYAAQLWLRMWQDRTGQRLDGVIETDPVALSYLLAATGPVQLRRDGRQVGADNVVALTESEVYQMFDDDAARDEYLQLIAEAVVKKAVHGSGDPVTMLRALGRASGERRLLVYSTHPQEQQVLARFPVGGTLPEGAGPVAGLALINGAGNKADYYLGQQLDYRLVGCDAGSQRTQVTVTLTNGVPPGSTLPDYVIGRVDLAVPGQPVPNRGGQTRLFAQVYLAQGAVLAGARLDGRPAAVQAGEERGRPVVRADLTLGAGQSRTLVLDVVEPAAPGPARTWTTPLVKPAVVTADSFDCAAQD